MDVAGLSRAVLGVSGGIDSAVVAAIMKKRWAKGRSLSGCRLSEIAVREKCRQTGVGVQIQGAEDLFGQSFAKFRQDSSARQQSGLW